MTDREMAIAIVTETYEVFREVHGKLAVDPLLVHMMPALLMITHQAVLHVRATRKMDEAVGHICNSISNLRP